MLNFVEKLCPDLNSRSERLLHNICKDHTVLKWVALVPQDILLWPQTPCQVDEVVAMSDMVDEVATMPDMVDEVMAMSDTVDEVAAMPGMVDEVVAISYCCLYMVTYVEFCLVERWFIFKFTFYNVNTSWTSS